MATRLSAAFHKYGAVVTGPVLHECFLTQRRKDPWYSTFAPTSSKAHRTQRRSPLMTPGDRYGSEGLDRALRASPPPPADRSSRFRLRTVLFAPLFYYKSSRSFSTKDFNRGATEDAENRMIQSSRELLRDANSWIFVFLARMCRPEAGAPQCRQGCRRSPIVAGIEYRRRPRRHHGRHRDWVAAVGSVVPLRLCVN